MADNFNQATVSPNLPASLFSEAELQSLETACGLTSYPTDTDTDDQEEE